MAQRQGSAAGPFDTPAADLSGTPPVSQRILSTTLGNTSNQASSDGKIERLLKDHAAEIATIKQQHAVDMAQLQIQFDSKLLNVLQTIRTEMMHTVRNETAQQTAAMLQVIADHSALRCTESQHVQVLEAVVTSAQFMPDASMHPVPLLVHAAETGRQKAVDFLMERGHTLHST